MYETQHEAIQALIELGSHGNVVNQAVQGEDSDDDDQLDHQHERESEDIVSTVYKTCLTITM